MAKSSSNSIRVHLKTNEHPQDGVYRFELAHPMQLKHSSSIALEKINLPQYELTHCERGKEEYYMTLECERRKTMSWRKWQALWTEVTTSDKEWHFEIITSPHTRRKWKKNTLSDLRGRTLAPTLREIADELNRVLEESLSPEWESAYPPNEWPQFIVRDDASKGLALRLPKLKHDEDYHIKWRDVRFRDRSKEQDAIHNRIFHIDDFWSYYPLTRLLNFLGINTGLYRQSASHPPQFVNELPEILPIVGGYPDEVYNHSTSTVKLHLDDLVERPNVLEIENVSNRIVLECELTYLPIAELQRKLQELTMNTEVTSIKLIQQQPQSMNRYSLQMEGDISASLSVSENMVHLLKLTTSTFHHIPYNVKTGTLIRNTSIWKLNEPLDETSMRIAVPAHFWCHCNLVSSSVLPDYGSVSLLRHGAVKHGDEFEKPQYVPLVCTLFDMVEIYFTLPYTRKPYIFKSPLPLMLQLQILV